MRALFSFFVCLLWMPAAFAQKTAFDPQKLAVRWEVIENNYQQKTQTLSAFTLTNTGKTPLPATGWGLYFNFVRTIKPGSANGPLQVDHLNGDFFRLVPKPEMAPLRPGASIRVEFVSDAWVLNVTDAPGGLYWVRDSQPEKGIPLPNYTVVPSTEPKQTTRFPGDKPGFVGPQAVYAQNKALTDIPENQLPKILPSPTAYRETGSAFTLTGDVSIMTDAAFQREAGYLANELAAVLGKKTSVTTQKAPGQIQLQMAAMAPGAYQLRVNADGVVISAASGEGICYGIQSLKMLLPPMAWTKPQSSLPVPGVEVTDAPRFGWRAMMLDVARNFQPKTQVLKLLDLMALYKLNILHFHLNDDEGWRVEIPSLPELTAVGSKRGHTLDNKAFLQPSYGSGPDVQSPTGSGFYSKADFIEILKYAAERHISVVPEIETPGHARAAVKAMDARYARFMAENKPAEAGQYLLRDLQDVSVYRSVQSWNDNVMNVALPSVYRFLETVTDDLLAMYREAGAPIQTIHFGGDEVPAGVWEKSPACQALMKTDPAVKNVDDLWYYYFRKVNELVRKQGLYLYGWEEVGMRKTRLDGKAHMIPNPDFAGDGVQVDVWNNVLGWGAEDLAYKLANAGYKVVLSPVTNYYFDMAYQKSFDEPGYYWGGFTDVDKGYYFIPYDYFKSAREDRLGNPLDRSVFNGKERLTDYGKENIIGIQGLLWSETVLGPQRMEYMMLPKLIGLAERAWASDPAWATGTDEAANQRLYAQAWNTFVNQLGKRELPRLGSYAGGFAYRIPTVGAVVEDGAVRANVQLPGFTIRYTTDGSQPNANSAVYAAPVTTKGTIKLRAFSAQGLGGRTVVIRH
ncbi:family 20 glycosylhydrolase [Arsenicibacter rosenii]|uniref:beta-N-acetylhexosaminidase n=1 Tax=Arsenicibacter rosenii TaxID=1750698 RepID=A0A1S2VNV8_9BACT|nr:family 20 glycosylhydrolase [Arsenicibacter rosenii]OIN60453.1 beta-N-acetylhexosaminidase [Arsenicibacter rosenii]